MLVALHCIAIGTNLYQLWLGIRWNRNFNRTHGRWGRSHFYCNSKISILIDLNKYILTYFPYKILDPKFIFFTYF